MSDEKETLMEFPCAFALKVMVEAAPGVNADMLALIAKHVEEDLSESNISERPSSKGKYTALTITFTAHSKAQLDNIYMDLSKHDKVRMAL